MKTILVAYDDTASGEVALERAAELTAALDAKLIVITVAPVVPAARGIGPIDPVDSPARRARVLAGARADLTARGVEAQYVRSTGRPADAIIRAAEKYDADLIIVGRRSTNPVKRMLGECVSESVLHKARCAVLLAHTPKVRAKATHNRLGLTTHPVEPARERLAA
jgi:nucleotide-binding universal stress UspA family protein